MKGFPAAFRVIPILSCEYVLPFKRYEMGPAALCLFFKHETSVINWDS